MGEDFLLRCPPAPELLETIVAWGLFWFLLCAGVIFLIMGYSLIKDYY